ncbi:isocitrate lyase/phosphoenolpyruvate mutase family protein [Mesorhizobium sp. LHD-90]|uniref:isocitrate lyase/PEP mutase family protein n=1 Tax=Mesorhizobium sp. LHD-90 TaxID=3071414 RepID=UPI0027DECCAF|nr:isocitrate lyase/phosphoenolpyruvate mutase family protein [Mesorhizobium sp. LHD-90]MDQ6436168.1 isocitrate lyase/phosphoenolpyruvate mutase family protein [Mesorhizobium sp. LHD-90]
MDKGRVFHDLHQAAGAFVMPNPWDPGTAKLLASLGFKALATTSAGFAFSRGLVDGAVGFEAMMAHCRDMVAAVDLPINADLEKGKGDSPDSAAETIFAAEAAGLAGCSIEDHTGDPSNPIYGFSQAVERVAAAAEAARAVKHGFVFTARCENFLWGRNDLDDTIRRLQAFAGAGADVVYAPGISDIETVRTICSSVSRPVNVLAVPELTVAALAEAGVKRISLGSKLTNFAFGAVRRAAAEILENGSFEFSRQGMSFAEMGALFSKAG